MCKFYDIAGYLLRDVRVNIRRSKNVPAMFYATKNKDEYMIKLLLKYMNTDLYMYKMCLIDTPELYKLFRVKSCSIFN